RTISLWTAFEPAHRRRPRSPLASPAIAFAVTTAPNAFESRLSNLRFDVPDVSFCSRPDCPSGERCFIFLPFLAFGQQRLAKRFAGAGSQDLPHQVREANVLHG